MNQVGNLSADSRVSPILPELNQKSTLYAFQMSYVFTHRVLPTFLMYMWPFGANVDDVT
jgi:hypothetical protein